MTIESQISPHDLTLSRRALLAAGAATSATLVLGKAVTATASTGIPPARTQALPTSTALAPAPAIPAILAAMDTRPLVGIGEYHPVRWTIAIDDTVAGMVQDSEEPEPCYRHATLDIFIDPAWHNKGLGTEAARRTLQHLVTSRGHHRITIDPAVMNAAAIRAYEKVGFRRVGVMRAYERDAAGDMWHDGLLMEFVARPD